MTTEHKPHQEPLDIARKIVVGEYRCDNGPRLMTLGDQERMSAELVRLQEQVEALLAAVQKELDFMDGFPDVEDGSPIALVIESLRLALSNPASMDTDGAPLAKLAGSANSNPSSEGATAVDRPGTAPLIASVEGSGGQVPGTVAPSEVSSPAKERP